jgi:hypothetical protein
MTWFIAMEPTVRTPLVKDGVVDAMKAKAMNDELLLAATRAAWARAAVMG